MKKMIRRAGMLLAFAMMAFLPAFAAEGDDCNGVVDKVYDSFDLVVVEINKCTTMQEMMGLNYNGIIDKELGDVPDSCVDYELSGADKTKLEGGFDKVIDAMAGKMADFTNGQISKTVMLQQMEPLKQEIQDASRRSKTIGEWLENVSTL